MAHLSEELLVKSLNPRYCTVFFPRSTVGSVRLKRWLPANCNGRLAACGNCGQVFGCHRPLRYIHPNVAMEITPYV